MTDYVHDVFISYRREKMWTPWTRKHFKDLLAAYLQPDLTRPPRIFVDEALEEDVGADWVDGLGRNLATSKVLIPMFSADYFSSDWCVHELALMHERMLSCPAIKLIIPVVVHDGDQIPLEIRRLQPAKEFSEYRIAGLNPETTDYHELSKAVKKLSPEVAKAIQAAPDFDPAWVDLCRKRFDLIYNRARGTRIAPTSFALITPPAAAIPRPSPIP